MEPPRKLWPFGGVVRLFRVLSGQLVKGQLGLASSIPGSDKFPVALSHRPPALPLEVEGLVFRGGLRVFYDRQNTAPVKGDLWWINPAELEDSRVPVHDRDHLVAGRALRQPGRVADNGRGANASFEEGPLAADPLAGISAAAVGSVAVPLRVAAGMFGASNSVALGGVAVVALEDHDRVLAQVELFEPVENLSDVVIRCRDDRGVGPPRHGQVLVALVELLVGLLGIVLLALGSMGMSKAVEGGIASWAGSIPQGPVVSSLFSSEGGISRTLASWLVLLGLTFYLYWNMFVQIAWVDPGVYAVMIVFVSFGFGIHAMADAES